MSPEHQQIGPYLITGELGRGGMGVVYRAKQPELEREVAVKVMLGGQHAGDEAYDRFVREARAAGKLRHPNIVPVHDVGVHEGLPYIVMDFVPGTSLGELLAEGDLPVRRGLEIVRDVAQALAHAHDNDVIHRDVKPGNILIEEETGRALLTDFGLAREVGSDAGLTRSGATLGTPAYMSPEQALSNPVDHRTDVYGIGAVLYEVLTGRPPFEGESPYSIIGQVIKHEPAKVRSLTSSVSRDVELICETAMAKELERRYASAGLLSEDIERWLRGEAITARAPSMMYLLSRRAKRHKVPLVAVVLSLIATAAAVYWLAIRPGMLERASDRATLQRSLQNKQAKEAEFAGHLAASRWADAITLGRGLWGVTPPLPDLHDRNLAHERRFAGLRRPYAIDLPGAYLARGRERIDSGDPLARGDLANAFQLGRDLPEHRGTARAALVAMGSALAARHDLEEANYIAALAHQAFGTGHPSMRALLARVAQANDRHDEAVALWDSVAADPAYADEAKFQMAWMRPALPEVEIPDPGKGWRLLRSAPAGGLSAASYDAAGVLRVQAWDGEAWSGPQGTPVTPPEGFTGADCSTADVDGDGFNDLICVARARAPNRSWVVVCRRREDGSWRPGTGTITPEHAGAFSTGDFMRDGVRDLWGAAGRALLLLRWEADRLTFDGHFIVGNYVSHTSIDAHGDLLVYIAPFLAEAARKPAWRRGQSGLWLQTPGGEPEPATNANWPGGAGFPWGYRIVRLRDRGDGWVLPVEQLEGRYGWGHISVMPDGRLLVRSQAGLDMQVIVPGITNGLVMTDDRDGRFSLPVPFGDPATYRRLGAAAWYVWPVEGETWFATWGRGGVWRLVSPDGDREKHIGLRVDHGTEELDDDPWPELVVRHREAAEPMRVRGFGTFTPPALDTIDLKPAGDRTLPAGLTPEQQLFDAGLYDELVEVCRERIAAGGDLHWQYEMGRALLALERWAEAAAAFEVAAQDAVLAPDALLRRVHALEQLRDWPALQTTLERLLHKRQRDTYARDAVRERLAWVRAAQQLAPRVAWENWAEAPLLLEDALLATGADDGGVELGGAAAHHNGAGCCIRYAGGPVRLTVRFRYGDFGGTRVAGLALERVDDDGDRPAQPGPLLALVGRTYGANDRPGVAWGVLARSRDGRTATAEAPGMAWMPTKGEIVTAELQYVPGYELLWGELRGEDGTVHLRLPVAKAPAALEHGVYQVRMGGWRHDDHTVQLPHTHSPGHSRLLALAVAGAPSLRAFEPQPTTPRVAFLLGNGAAVTGRRDAALEFYRRFDELTRGSTDPLHRAWAVEVELTRARLAFDAGDLAAAQAHAVRALELDPPFTRERLNDVRCHALTPALRAFLRGVIGVSPFPWRPRPAPK